MSEQPAMGGGGDAEAWDVDGLLGLPRVSGLALSPDGARLVTQVQVVAPDRKSFAASLWEVDPTGGRLARRITRSTAGESQAAFLPSGDLLFSSGRRDPDVIGATDGKDPSGVWLLPAGGGEARPVLDTDDPVDRLLVARTSGDVLLRIAVHARSRTLDEDAAQGAERREAGVTARLLESYPARWWDHWLGPRFPRLWVGPPPADGRLAVQDLLPDVGTDLLDEAGVAISDDGRTVVAALAEGYERVARLWRLGRDGTRQLLAGADGFDWEAPVVAPDGSFTACLRVDRGGPDRATSTQLMVVPTDGGEPRSVFPSGVDPWVHEVAITPDSRALLVSADDHGETALFRIDLHPDGRTGATRLTASGSYSSPCISPDGRRVYAVHSTPLTPPVVVALDTTTPGQAPQPLPSPCTPPDPCARLERVRTAAADGAVVEGWLVLPEGACAERPAPLVLCIHGGPIASHAGWSWRWNPQLLAQRGMAVLLPDPALSTGYGQEFLARGWGKWGGAPYDDLMAITDAVVSRPDIDAERTAAAGGSYGGYMANWIAGHTDRFRCIVTHASVWSTEQMHGTTDFTPWFTGELGDPEDPEGRANLLRWSPEQYVAAIRTPMLVIHGDLDHRVPIGEGLRLWTALQRHGVPSRFLHFPDENHWIMRPQNIRLWYATVLAFLDEHLAGKPFEAPPLL